MPIPLGYSRTVLSGHLGNGEIFQTGFWASEAPSDANAAATQAQAVATYLEAHWSDAGSPTGLIRSDSGYDKVTVYSYPNGGPDADYVGEAALTGGVGAGSGVLPEQCSLCITLQTGLSGRRHRGRMFVPCNGKSLLKGQMDQSTVGSISQWWAAFVAGMNSAFSPGFVVVLSQVSSSSQRVTSVTVDSRLDIQRRRADRETVLYKVDTQVA